jgi:pyrroline-5-carboxylate reductase
LTPVLGLLKIAGGAHHLAVRIATSSIPRPQHGNGPMSDPHTAAGGRLAILGGGNIGLAIAGGLTRAGRYAPGEITITRRHAEPLEALGAEGYRVTTDNVAAVRESRIVIVAVPPARLPELLDGIGPELDPARHVLVSVVTGARTRDILARVAVPVPVVLAMPNTAIAIGESMTCLAGTGVPAETMASVRALFETVGLTIEIDEELIGSATALCACGVAFFLRAVRAASQGGIEIGFHADEAIRMAAQTARGAASLLLAAEHHPERQIDAVTTPRGCTISGLNEMEHRGFSSAMIKGLVTSAAIARGLYPGADGHDRETNQKH